MLARRMRRYELPLSGVRSQEGRFHPFLFFAECFHTRDGNFQRLGKFSHVPKTFGRELFLQLMSSEPVDCGAQKLWIFFDRINHARKHEREFDLAAVIWGCIPAVWSHYLRGHGSDPLPIGRYAI